MSNAISHAEDSAHAGPIKNPRQFVYTVLAAFVLPIFIIIGLVLFVTYKFKPSGLTTPASMALNGVTEQSAEQLMTARLQKIGMVEIRDANRPLKAGEEVFKAQCSACHAAGVAGAPKFGDAAAWAPRISHGYEALLTSALKGKGAMGPQGGGDFEDVEIGRAVVYMTNAAGGNLPVPDKAGAAPAAADAPAAGAPAVQAATPAAPVSAVLAAAAPTNPAPADAASSPAALTAVAAATATALAGNVPAAPTAAPANNTATAPAPTTLAATAPTAAMPPAPPTAGVAPAAAAPVPAAMPVNAAAGAALYKSACFACHAAGVAGSPKFGDKAAWAPRIAGGIPMLVASVKNGKGAMPPRGGSAASDADLLAAVEYMVDAAK